MESIKDLRSCKTYLRAVTDGEDSAAGVAEELGGLCGGVVVRGECVKVGLNEEFDIDVNKMLRVTLAGLLDKGGQVRRIAKKYGARLFLEIVPYVCADSELPNQYLSLERDIIAFLYESGAEMDLDYYVI